MKRYYTTTSKLFHQTYLKWGQKVLATFRGDKNDKRDKLAALVAELLNDKEAVGKALRQLKGNGLGGFEETADSGSEAEDREAEIELP